MKILIYLFLVLPITAGAQTGTQWGGITNGLRLGATILLKDNVGVPPPECILLVQNVSSNQRKIYLHRAPAEIRYEMKLLNPQGQSVDMFPGKLLSLGSSFQHGGTVVTNEPPAFVVSFSVSELFNIQTNGLHALIVSERFTTNQVVPKSDYSFPFSLFYQPLPPSAYFLMPPVTNTFEISTNDIRR